MKKGDSVIADIEAGAVDRPTRHSALLTAPTRPGRETMTDPITDPRGAGQLQRREAGHAIVVTGAAGGIGTAVVCRLAADGWTIVAADTDAATCKPLADEFPELVSAIRLDVTDDAAVTMVAARLRETDTAASGLVNVAGVLQDVEPLLTHDPQTMRRVWEVNYFGAQACVQAFTPLMVASGGGAIVNITSINAHRPLPLHAYAPAKAALASATTLAAGELGRYGIRVNAVAPGFTLTPTLQRKLDSGTRDASAMTAHAALGRLVAAGEIASTVSFLLSDEASAITGVSIPVDAGWTATSHWMNFGDHLTEA
ncbi:SDR family oxidoreductase [Streptomyces sp. GD-15H]|uniref:SDR family NAD(P)-dependent oxidoreductase n=1 Tax=Streptomyces sp. GD-15H TaxID=3129112 RepID=UPI00325042BF